MYGLGHAKRNSKAEHLAHIERQRWIIAKPSSNQDPCGTGTHREAWLAQVAKRVSIVPDRDAKRWHSRRLIADVSLAAIEYVWFAAGRCTAERRHYRRLATTRCQSRGHVRLSVYMLSNNCAQWFDWQGSGRATPHW